MREVSESPTPYDPACAELAAAVLRAADAPHPPDFHARVHSMALEIQRAIEHWYDAHAEPEAERA